MMTTLAWVLSVALPLALIVSLVLVVRRSSARIAACEALRRTAEASLVETRAALAALEERFRPVIDAEAERRRVLDEVTSERTKVLTDLAAKKEEAVRDMRNQRTIADRALAEVDHLQTISREELSKLEQRLESLRSEVSLLDEQANLQSFGFYRPHYDFESSDKYGQELDRIREKQKAMLKSSSTDKAAYCQIAWTVDGSAAKGKQSIGQTLRLMLRAFNGESDAAIGKVRYNNVTVMEARIEKAFEVINGLAAVQQCFISKSYCELKLKELYLVHENQEKVQAEREEQRLIREQMREEEKAVRELERAKAEAEEEEQRYADALAKARKDVEGIQGAKQAKLLEKIGQLEQRLVVAQQQKERAIARAQLTRSGHVYVISNLGSFGEHIYKIGMTRRLDPLDRIRELGDASVPFAFDVHAVIYSEDAPGLEAKLHRAFAERRVNLVNDRKEFFGVHIDDVVRIVRENHDDVLITKTAEAQEYRKTLAMLSGSTRSQTGWTAYDRRATDRESSVGTGAA
jgi:hypothetical protein